ncbi:MAG TPA: pantetheine-phosphate adenylyltransferase [Acidimicrobiales bacterium]|nr:pantetheine-phosphate adenylyltransferase [Acidimicrobiales bacterium]
MTTALVPGSFDPFHNGHLEVVEAASALFEQVVVAPVPNPQKAGSMFDLGEREAMIAESTGHLRNVRIEAFGGLTVRAADAVGAAVVVKGVRSVADFDNEMQMAHMNFHLSGVRTVLLPTSPRWSYVASTLVREITRLGGDVSDLVPPPVAARLVALAAR